MEQLLTLYSEVQSTDVRWLWYPFIAIGKITLLQGDPGDGKSTMMMNLIAELSTGGKTPDGCKIGAPQKVIYDDDQRIDTILDVENQRQNLKELAEKYTSIRRKDYLEWRIRLEDEMIKAEEK